MELYYSVRGGRTQKEVKPLKVLRNVGEGLRVAAAQNEVKVGWGAPRAVGGHVRRMAVVHVRHLALVSANAVGAEVDHGPQQHIEPREVNSPVGSAMA